MIEELFPRCVFLVAQAQGDQRIPLGLFGLADQLHVGLFGISAALSGVAFDARADEVLPGFFAFECTWLHVVD